MVPNGEKLNFDTMNNIDKQYIELLKTIRDYGVEKEDRTGTGTKSIFGYTIRHNMKDGFPLLTTKKMHFKSIVTELCWFLQGRTDLRYLLQHDCHIWTGDAYKVYDKDFDAEHPPFSGPYPKRLTKKEFEEKILNDDDFNRMYGDLGPIYGKQWRNWSGYEKVAAGWHHGSIVHYRDVPQGDQLAKLIDDLKNNPDSRRLIVNAWNVGELDQMTLPPCHYGFQVYTRELSLEERYKLANINGSKENLPGEPNYTEEQQHSMLDELVPKRAISLMWNQRSVDTFLGLPFNIASYALLLEIIAREVNMVPDQLIGSLGDTHLYNDHMDAVNEQLGTPLTVEQRIDYWFNEHKPNRDVVDNFDTFTLAQKLMYLDKANVPSRTREPFALPKVKISAEVKTAEGAALPTYSPADFELVDYKSHPTIKAPLSN